MILFCFVLIGCDGRLGVLLEINENLFWGWEKC